MSTGNRFALLTAVAVAAAGAAALAPSEGAAQTGYTQSYGATQVGPTAPVGIAPPQTTGIGTAPAGRPAYQSNTGLPYGAGNPAPYAYGGSIPYANDPNKKAPAGATGAAATGAGAGAGRASLPTATVPGPGAKPEDAGTGEVQIDPATGQPMIDATGTAGLPEQPFDPKSGAAIRTYSGPGNGQPVIRAAPDFKPGDPYARGAGAPGLPAPIGASPYTRPYTVDAMGNYYTPQGAYVGKVDNKGQVRDRYGNVRGVVAR